DPPRQTRSRGVTSRAAPSGRLALRLRGIPSSGGAGSVPGGGEARRMNQGTEIRKPLRARKTMAMSSRKQVEHLCKMKAVPAGEGAAGQGRPAGARGLCPGAQEELRSREAGAGQEPLPAKEPLASLLVNSEISIYKDPQEMLQDLPTPDVKRFLNAGTLPDILWYLYKKESGSFSLKRAEASLESGPAGQLLDQLPGASSTHENADVDTATKMLACQALPALCREESRFGMPERDGAPTVSLGDGQRKRMVSSNSEEDEGLSKRSKASGNSPEGTAPAVERAESGLGKAHLGLEKSTGNAAWGIALVGGGEVSLQLHPREVQLRAAPACPS
ncbi:hypothetical protein E2320_012295, partial [Naja naja]